MSKDLPPVETEAETNLTQKGLVVASLTGSSRILGLCRDIVISYFLGAGPLADAFFVAFKIPNFFRRLFAEGAFQQAFIPVLADYKEQRSHSELVDFVRTVAGTFAVVLLVISLLGSVLATPLIKLFTLGAWTGEERELAAIHMLSIMFPYLGLISLTAYAGAVLNSYQRFAVTAGAPALLSVCVMVAAAWAALISGHVAFAMAWGVLVAGLLQLLLHLPSLGRIGHLQLPRVSFGDPGIKRVMKLIVPGVYAASAGQVNILVGTIICAQLAVGTVSWFYYADRLIQLPMALLAVALQTILLPNLSRLVKQGNEKQYSDTIDWGMRIGLLIGLPASLALCLIASPIIATLFLRGAFDQNDLEMTSLALQIFALGLLPMVLTRVAGPAYFAREDMHTPFVYATIGVGVNIVVSLSLFWWLGLAGVAIATVLAAYVQCFLLVRGLITSGFYQPSRSLLKFTLIGFTGCIALTAGLVFLTPDDTVWLLGNELARIGNLVLVVLIGLAIYGLTVFAFGLRPRHLIHRV